ncbi:MAG: hypothetical protein M9887_12615 [Chitinophagales bacterium]|nr:hypothetical protein [Chitinophagales bacterium]
MNRFNTDLYGLIKSVKISVAEHPFHPRAINKEYELDEIQQIKYRFWNYLNSYPIFTPECKL